TDRLFSAERKEILSTFYGFLQPAEKLLEVFAALDEVDVRRVDDEEIGGRVAEEEVFVSVRDLFDVGGGDLRFLAGGFLGDAGAEDFGLGLEIDDEIGSGNVRSHGFVVAVVEFELFVIEIEIGENAVFFEEEIGKDRAGSFDGKSFADAFLAFDEEIHLGAEGGAGLFFVEIGKEGIVFAVVDSPGVKTLRKDFGERGFADAKWTFDNDEAGGLRAALWNGSALGCGGFIGRHRFVGPRKKTLKQP